MLRGGVFGPWAPQDSPAGRAPSSKKASPRSEAVLPRRSHAKDLEPHDWAHKFEQVKLLADGVTPARGEISLVARLPPMVPEGTCIFASRRATRRRPRRAPSPHADRSSSIVLCGFSATRANPSRFAGVSSTRSHVGPPTLWAVTGYSSCAGHGPTHFASGTTRTTATPSSSRSGQCALCLSRTQPAGAAFSARYHGFSARRHELLAEVHVDRA